MMGLPKLEATILCMHAGPKIMFLGLFLRGFLLEVSWQIFNINNNPSYTILVSNESSGSKLSICVTFSDEIDH